MTRVRLIAELVETLQYFDSGHPVISWAAPTPYFGELGAAKIATVGINPSNLEFCDGSGHALTGRNRRLATLQSLGLDSWLSASGRELSLIENDLNKYFSNNPYDAWFAPLDRMLQQTGLSYYRAGGACHLDIVPFATAEKWSLLPTAARSELLMLSGPVLGELVTESNLALLVLNGRSVVRAFQEISDVAFTEECIPEWSLPRANGDIRGVAYFGSLTEIGGVPVDHAVMVLGFNHNIQSSFGVTRGVMTSIGERIYQEYDSTANYSSR